MALVLCLACVVLSVGGAWLATGSKGDAPLARLRHVGHLCQLAIEALASTELIAALLAWEPFQAGTREVAEALGRRGHELSTAQAAALLAVGLVFGAALLGLGSRSVVGACVWLAACAVGLVVRRSAGHRRRQREVARAMPQVLRTMAAALQAGHTLVKAIEYVGLHAEGPAAEPFVRASLRLRCGMSIEDALDLLESELQAPGVGLMASALVVSQRTGSPLRELLLRVALLVERQEEYERLLAVKTAQARLSVRIVCCLPVLMVAVLSLISPDFQQGLMTPTGTTCLLLATALDGLALLIIRRIMGGLL